MSLSSSETRRNLQINLWNNVLNYETPEPESDFTSPGESIMNYIDYCVEKEIQVSQEGLESLSWKAEAPNRPPNFYRMRKFSEPQIEKIGNVIGLLGLNKELFVVCSLTEASEIVSEYNLDGRILDAAECCLTGADHFFSEDEHKRLTQRISELRDKMLEKMNICIKHTLLNLGMTRLEDKEE